MVLRAAHGLHALARSNAAVVDIMRDIRRTDKADRADGRVVEDRIDHFLVAMHDLENPGRHACFQKEFRQTVGHARVAFRWLQNEGIADTGRNRTHPQRDHRGEIERRNACANAQWLAHRPDIDAGSRAMGIFPLQHMRQAAAELHNLKPALNIALAVGDDLAMFGAQHMSEFVHMLFDQGFEIEHHARTALRVHCGPCGLRCLCGGHSGIQHGPVTQHYLRLNTAIIGIHDVRKTRS